VDIDFRLPAVPADEQSLGLEVDSLSEQAVELLLGTIDDPDPATSPEAVHAAGALAEDVHIWDRYEAVVFHYAHRGSSRTSSIDGYRAAELPEAASKTSGNVECLTVVELAEAVGLSQTPCARRIRALEQAGVIEGYAAIVNPVRLGLKVQAFVQVKLQQHADDVVMTFQRELAKFDEVISCFAVTGESDFRHRSRPRDAGRHRAQAAHEDTGRARRSLEHCAGDR
jgi:hypothetical protein